MGALCFIFAVSLYFNMNIFFLMFLLVEELGLDLGLQFHGCSSSKFFQLSFVLFSVLTFSVNFKVRVGYACKIYYI